jgi:hypothetical protein
LERCLFLRLGDFFFIFGILRAALYADYRAGAKAPFLMAEGLSELKLRP